MKRLIALGDAGLTGVLAFLAAPMPSALAGGWAVTTLDSVPAPGAGEEVEVGFTIRQHGVTPVRPDGDVGIEITSPTGVTRYFPGRPSGPTGHFLAAVVFPETGTFTWTARQGWFAPQPLGSVVIGSRSAGATPTGDHYRWPAAFRFGLLAVGAALLVFSLWDTVRGPRRRRLVATAP
jgi:hypothetical protein